MEKYIELYTEHLNQLKKEVSSYKDEANLWKLTGDIKNTPGNLALHACGNLEYNFGTILLSNGYVRDRDSEFARKNVPKDEIIREIDSTLEVVTEALTKLTPQVLNNVYPSDFYGPGQTIGTVIVRLAFHLAYHLGQINYHRRILDA